MITKNPSEEQLLDELFETIYYKVKSEPSSETVQRAIAEVTGKPTTDPSVQHLSSLFILRLLGVNRRLIGSR